MRLFCVCNCPAFRHLGTGYVISGYVEGLRLLGHHVDLIEPDSYEITKWMRPRGSNYRRALGMLLVTKKYLRNNFYDIVEFYGGDAWLATLWLRNFKKQRPLVIQHTNGPEPRYNAMLDSYFGRKRRKWFQFDQSHLMESAFSSADSVVTVSNFDRDWLVAQNLLPKERILAIENPLPEVFFSKHKTQAREKIIGYCGTWLPKKGIDVLSKDLNQILMEFPEYRILLIGVGHSFHRSDVFPDVNPERIEVFPYIADKEQLRDQYDRMDIFVFPSVIESFGIALAEAMARGCAAITTKVGLGASIKNRKEALVLEASRSPLLYDALKLLIEDEKLKRELSDKARSRVQGLRWSNATKMLANRYEDWLAMHNDK